MPGYAVVPTGPYSWTGLPFKKLPANAQKYLQDAVGVTEPGLASQMRIDKHRETLCYDLWRNLQGKHLDEVRALLRKGKRKSTEEDLISIIRQPFISLQSEAPFRDHIYKFDALFWLQMESLNKEDAPTTDQQQQQRNSMCTIERIVSRVKSRVQRLGPEQIQAGNI